jgi:putative ABC transport system substrate-binding protein
LAIHIRRREFIFTLGGAAAAWPFAARAQQPAMPVIGFLSGGSSWEYAQLAAAFRKGLSETGYEEGSNVWIEYRWAEGRYDRLPALAADLARRKVAVIASNSPATIAAKAVTTTIPIVFITGSDPVKLGFVASLNRPGGNVTGVSFFAGLLEAKRLGILRELVPTAASIAALLNPKFPDAEAQSKEVQEAARTLGLQVQILRASIERELDTAFEKLTELLACSSAPTLSSSVGAITSSRLRPATPFRRFTFSANTQWPVAWRATGQTPPTPIVRSASIPAGFSRERSRLICRSCSQPSSSLSST